METITQDIINTLDVSNLDVPDVHAWWQSFHLQQYAENLLASLGGYLPNILLALVLLWGGFRITTLLVRALERTFEHRHLDPTLERFLSSLVSLVLRVVIIITAIGVLGVPMTSFIALLGTIGLAVGLSLQGSLSNFAGGVLIIFFKPFRVGDYVKVDAYEGTVQSINIFYTKLKTLDNKAVLIPNGQVSNTAIQNYWQDPLLRIDFTFSISYRDDIDTAKQVLQDIVDADERIVHLPSPHIAVRALGSSSVDLLCRVWVANELYWDVYYDMFEKVKKAYDANKISIPFTQQDVYVHMAPPSA
ncbi:mechanosensitive ion channel [Candidatus Peribacteria bacterium]|nr:mechanosensitive ion channel [Candidatus Peribacteria bacterium]